MKVIVFFVAILSLILFLRILFFFEHEKAYMPGDTIETEITLLDEPQVRYETQFITWNSIRIEIPLDLELHYGDTISLKGEIEEDSFKTSSGEEIKFLSIKQPVIDQIGTKNPLILSTSFIRNKVWSEFSKKIPRNEAGLLYGIVFGGTQGFSNSAKDAFRNTGVLHVVAASGMNVTLVSGFLFAITSRIFKRNIAILISIFGIFYYALLAGFEPSILRASIMASIAFTAAILGRQNYGLLTLLLTAFIMIMISPKNILDIGFLLSFSSTLGIVTIKPFFDSLSFFRKTKGFSDDISTTVSAQIGSLPFMGAFFSSYSVISIFVNALVLWTIPFLMILGGVASICAIVLPFVTFIPLYISLPLLWYFQKVISLFSEVPILKLQDLPISIWIGYYLMLLSLILVVKRK